MECGDTVCGRVNAWNDYLRAKVAEWAAASAQSMTEGSHSMTDETRSMTEGTQSSRTPGTLADRWEAEEAQAKLAAGTLKMVEEAQTKMTLFSSHEVISDILDNPERYGFSKEDVAKEGGEIWVDDLHLSSAVHRILAERFLERIPLPTRS